MLLNYGWLPDEACSRLLNMYLFSFIGLRTLRTYSLLMPCVFLLAHVLPRLKTSLGIPQILSVPSSKCLENGPCGCGLLARILPSNLLQTSFNGNNGTVDIVRSAVYFADVVA